MNVNHPDKIVLLGYMGSGKTTVGKHLASFLEREFIDLDAYIEKKEGASITVIIENKGAIYFRKREQECLKDILSQEKRVVLSLGGGTPCYYDNMDLIKRSLNTQSIYLRATVPFLTGRLFHERDTRPLIARFDLIDELAEFVGKHLLERSGFYNQATHQVFIENKSVREIADEINSSL